MRRLSWRVKLPGLFAIVLGASLLLQLLFFLPSIRNQELGLIESNQNAVAQGIALDLDSDLARIVESLEKIAEQPEFADMDIATQQQSVPQIADLITHIRSLWVMDADGWFVAGTTTDLSIYRTRAYNDLPYYTESFVKGQIYFSEPKAYSNNTVVTTAVSVPILSATGERVGALYGSMLLNNVIQELKSYTLHEGHIAYLVDTEGTVVAHSEIDLFALEEGPLSLDYSDQPLVLSIIAGGIGSSREYEHEGMTSFGSYSILESNGWGVVVEAPMSALLGETEALNTWLLWGNVGIFVIALAITVVFAQQITAQRKRAEAELVQHRDHLEELVEMRTAELGERVKEQTCLYSISELAGNPKYALEDILHKAVDLIPPGWQYPQVTCARITLNGVEFQTNNFKKTAWGQSCNIHVNNKKAGLIEVFYLEQKPPSDDGPFLKEERALLDTLGLELGQAVERKQTEQALIKSEESVRLMVSEVKDYAIVMLEPGGVIASWNEGAQRIKQYSADEIIGKHMSILYNEKDVKADKPGSLLKEALKTGRAEDEGWRVRKDGSQFMASVVITTIYDEGGKHIGFSKVTRDITQQRQAEQELSKHREHLEELVELRTKELQEAQEGLLRSERLATLGQFSGNISHELRNPLGVIDSSAYYLQKKLKDADEKVHEHLDRIRGSVNSSTAIIESLLNLTRMKEPQLQSYDLLATIDDAVATAKIPATLNILRNFPDSKVVISADHEQLRMAFKNIIKNANDAMGSKGTLTITVHTNSDNQAEITFADAGPGIATEDIDKIFQPLFSRKAKGIGFGLSISKMVIDKHGGTIKAESEPGKGAAFIIRLPVHASNDKEN